MDLSDPFRDKGAHVANVFLLPADVHCDQRHWRNDYAVLKRSFDQCRGGVHQLASGPGCADVILICGPLRNALFPSEVILNPVVRKNLVRCARISIEDDELPVLPGFYTSLVKSLSDQRFFRGGYYPHVAEKEPDEALSLAGPFPFLFSFMGDVHNHPVRRSIAAISDENGHVCDTTSHPGNFSGQSPEVYRAFKFSYMESMLKSKFILCPRGMCASSIRLFETMKAQRVPVVISDEWVAPPNIPWEEFCIFIPEKDVAGIPKTLAGYEGEFAARAKRAREVWDKYFSGPSLAQTATEWALDLLNGFEARTPKLFCARMAVCSGKLRQLKFWRRGVLSEMVYRLKRLLLW